MLRHLNCVSEILDLLLHEVTNSSLLNELCNACCRSMSSVSRAESVHNEYFAVYQISQLLGELLAVLGLLSATETCVLQNNDLAVFHCSNSSLSVLANNCVVSSECYLCVYQLAKSCSCGSQ